MASRLSSFTLLWLATIIGFHTAVPAVAAARPTTLTRGRAARALLSTQTYPQEYVSLIGAPLKGTPGGVVVLPPLRQGMDDTSVTFEIKQGTNVFMTGTGVVVPVMQLQLGTYTLEVKVADGSGEARGSCLLIIDDGTAAADAAAAQLAPSAASSSTPRFVGPSGLRKAAPDPTEGYTADYDSDTPYRVVSSQEPVVLP